MKKRKMQRQKKPADPPLTQKVLDNLKAKGPGTTDAIARRVKTLSRAVGKALSQLKKRGKAYFTTHAGEAVWRKGAPRQRAPRKQ